MSIFPDLLGKAELSKARTACAWHTCCICAYECTCTCTCTCTSQAFTAEALSASPFGQLTAAECVPAPRTHAAAAYTRLQLLLHTAAASITSTCGHSLYNTRLQPLAPRPNQVRRRTCRRRPRRLRPADHARARVVVARSVPPCVSAGEDISSSAPAPAPSTPTSVPAPAPPLTRSHACTLARTTLARCFARQVMAVNNLRELQRRLAQSGRQVSGVWRRARRTVLAIQRRRRRHRRHPSRGSWRRQRRRRRCTASAPPLRHLCTTSAPPLHHPLHRLYTPL